MTYRLNSNNLSERFVTGRSGARGFTLIEIIVSLAIVAIGMVAVINATTKHTQIAADLEARVLAGWVASSQVAQMRYDANINQLRPGSDADTVEMGGFRWRTRTQLEETEVEQVYLLTVEVKDADRRDEPPFAVITTALTDPL